MKKFFLFITFPIWLPIWLVAARNGPIGILCTFLERANNLVKRGDFKTNEEISRDFWRSTRE